MNLWKKRSILKTLLWLESAAWSFGGVCRAASRMGSGCLTPSPGWWRSRGHFSPSWLSTGPASQSGSPLCLCPKSGLNINKTKCFRLPLAQSGEKVESALTRLKRELREWQEQLEYWTVKKITPTIIKLEDLSQKRIIARQTDRYCDSLSSCRSKNLRWPNYKLDVNNAVRHSFPSESPVPGLWPGPGLGTDILRCSPDRRAPLRIEPTFRPAFIVGVSRITEE